METIRPTSGWTDFQGERGMSVKDLVAALRPLPGTALVPSSWVMEQLGAEADEVEAIADLTIAEIATEMDRAPSTVRSWIPQIDRAYKLGREWRVPRAALRAYLDALAAPKKLMPTAAPPDLGSWRKHLKGEAA